MGFSPAVITSTHLQGRKATNTAVVGETRFSSVTGCLGGYNKKTQRRSVEACEIRSCTTVEITSTKYTIREGLTILPNEYTVPLYSCS